jgi:hypothetical protein
MRELAVTPTVTVEATAYTVSAVPETIQDWDLFAITVERTAPGRYAIRRRSRCLSTDLVWEWESIPSDRTDEWLATHRFDLDTALRLAKEAAPAVTVNGHTVADALTWGGEAQ